MVQLTQFAAIIRAAVQPTQYAVALILSAALPSPERGVSAVQLRGVSGESRTERLERRKLCVRQDESGRPCWLREGSAHRS